jgi:3-dehydroquinate synthase
MNAAGRPAHSTREGCGRALIVEHQSFGVWTATTIDASIGVPIQQTTLDDGPAREATGNELCAVAESLASNLGPVDAVIFLAEDTGPAGNFEPKLIAGYPHPVWVVHPSIAIARSVPPQHSRFMVLDFSGGGSATMLKRGAGVGIEDLVECDGDLRSLLSRGPHRQVMHTDLLADVVGAFEPEASAAVAGSIESAPNPTPLQLESIFSELLHDFEPMLGVLQSFGYRTVVCVSAVFTSDIVAAAFTSAAARIGADRRLSFILITGQERYQGALKCVGAVRRSPGVWFAGTIDRPAFSLVSERRISYDVKHVARHIFDPDDTTLAAMLDDRPTLAVVDRTVDGHYGHALSAYAARHISLVGAVAVDATETAKSWTLVEQICDAAVRYGLGRDGVIMAVGGGITLDVAGMAASIFRRGVRYVRVPTTLVGMIDAGVGIKQGVNFASRKNILGSFYPPLGCVYDPTFLRTLSRRHLACGVAEMIKIALVCDRRLFEILESHIVDFLESQFQEPEAAADESILRAQLAMMQQLQPNLFEHDLQRWVDFGHTFSPTLELASHHELAHGEAVALDMLLATAIGVQRQVCDISVLHRMVSVYRVARLPVYSELCSSAVLATSLREARLHRGGDLNLVVPTVVGAGAFLQDIEPCDIDSAARIVSTLEPALAEM